MSWVREMFRIRVDRRKFRGVATQLEPTPTALMQRTGTHTSQQIGIGLGLSPQRARHHVWPADEQLIIENLPAVLVAARRIYRLQPDHVSFTGIYAAAVEGLASALQDFNLYDHLEFASFAQRRIRDAIIGILPRLVSEAEELRRKGKPIEEAIQRLRARLDRSPSELEISSELNIPLAAYHRLLGELSGIEIGSLHARRLKSSGEEDLVNLAGGPDDNPRLRFQKADMRERLTDAIRNLPEFEHLVLNLHYHEGLTLKEIGLVLDELEPRVSRIHASAILHLRSRLFDFGYS
jgi:RNA polymerase sigma factor for flagellar operon FliA